jgi:hypothetical protein
MKLSEMPGRDIDRIVRQLQGVAVGLDGVGTMLAEFDELAGPELDEFVALAKDLESRALALSRRIDMVRSSSI